MGDGDAAADPGAEDRFPLEDRADLLLAAVLRGEGEEIHELLDGLPLRAGAEADADLGGGDEFGEAQGVLRGVGTDGRESILQGAGGGRGSE